MLDLERILSILNKYPEDYSRVARELNTTRAEVLKFLEENPQNEQELKDSYLDSLTAYYKNWVRGGTVPENFSAPHALKILERERPDKWASRADERSKAKSAKIKPKVKKSLLDIPDNFFDKSASTEAVVVDKAPVSTPTIAPTPKPFPAFDFAVKTDIASPGEELMISDEDIEGIEIFSTSENGTVSNKDLRTQGIYDKASNLPSLEAQGVEYTFVAEDDLITIEDI